MEVDPNLTHQIVAQVFLTRDQPVCIVGRISWVKIRVRYGLG